MEETGAAQFYRDARILPIYEGTNGIQAADLVFRKILRDDGAVLKILRHEIKNDMTVLGLGKGDDFESIASNLSEGFEAVEKASQALMALAKEDLDYVAAVSVPYLKALSNLWAGALMARSALRAQEAMTDGGAGQSFLNDKIIAARFFAETYLPQAVAFSKTVQSSARVVVSSVF